MAAVYYKDWLVALTLTRENRVLCGKRTATGMQKQNFHSRIGITRLEQAGWRDERKSSGRKRDKETLF